MIWNLQCPHESQQFVPTYATHLKINAARNLALNHEAEEGIREKYNEIPGLAS